MSPTPTAGLNGGEGLTSLAGLGLENSSPVSQSSMTVAQHREGRERIRNVWESFRERLGLNRNPTAPQLDDDTPTDSDGQGNMRPGEIMLAEMARALNVGLGLNSDDASASGTSEAGATSLNRDAPRVTEEINPRRSVPAEDSFERFLLNLQSDLRTALSDDDTSMVLTTPAGNGGNQSGDDASILRRRFFHELPVGILDIDDHTDSEQPQLEYAPDSDDEDDDSFDGRTSTRMPTPMPSARPVADSPRDRTSLEAAEQEDASNLERGSPGINLWRLYRFQPIPATQVGSHAPATTSSPLPQSPAPSHPPSVPIMTSSQLPPSADSSSSPLSPTPSVSSSGSADSATAAAPPAEGASNVVVPIIVVGLQSVEMGQVQGRGRPVTNAGHTDFGDTDRGTRSTLFDDTRTAAPPDGPTTATRGRSWQSRAATALRNLRPGRRNNSSGPQSADGSGSRTFLIYVIGGESCFHLFLD